MEEHVQNHLDSYSRDGWRVHTFNRNPTSAVIDILFERDKT